MTWDNSQCISASVAIDRDKGFDANVNIECPNCRQLTLSYDRTSIFDMTAWCSTCRAGIKQGSKIGTARTR